MSGERFMSSVFARSDIMRRTLLGFLIVALLFPLGAMSLAAQDASPAATAMDGECVAPEIPPGTPTPMEEMDMGGPMASPEGDEGEMMMPPMPEPLTGGDPADDATAAEVEAAVHNIINCTNAGMFTEAAALMTPNALMAFCGTTNPYDGEACFGETPPSTVQSVENVQVHDDGRVSADVSSQLFHQQQLEQYVFARQDDLLLLDELISLDVEIPEGAAVITGEMVDYAFELDETSAPAGTIAFDVTNTGEYPHEIIIVGLPEGITVEDVFEDESLFEQVQFYGFTFSESGEDAPPLVLVDMEPGTYTLVCFIDVPEGVPHVMRGMILEFEVTAP
jgi:hypothetical protein